MAKTPVFVSWSGKYAGEVASALKKFLEYVLNDLDLFHSSEDIPAGTRWGDEIRKRLGAARVGVICVTQDKLESRWINYEAGAMANALTETKVIPFCIDLEVGALGSPLGDLNAVGADEVGTKRLVESINDECGESKVEQGKLDMLFGKFFPDLAADLKKARDHESARRKSPVQTQKASIEDMFRTIEDKLSLLTSRQSPLIVSSNEGVTTIREDVIPTHMSPRIVRALAMREVERKVSRLDDEQARKAIAKRFAELFEYTQKFSSQQEIRDAVEETYALALDAVQREKAS